MATPTATTILTITTTTCAPPTCMFLPTPFTSVLAIAALVGGRYAGWKFLDPLMGIVGGAVILRWSVGLCRGAARQLLDMVPSAALAQAVRERLEVGDVKVADLHVWDSRQ